MLCSVALHSPYWQQQPLLVSCSLWWALPTLAQTDGHLTAKVTQSLKLLFFFTLTRDRLAVCAL